VQSLASNEPLAPSGAGNFHEGVCVVSDKRSGAVETVLNGVTCVAQYHLADGKMHLNVDKNHFDTDTQCLD
jgi:hypothetical protein